MTAPGNAALLFILTAVFVACAAYAAGRLHQRFQEARDRAEAYRDGYDTATRSIFGMAARLIGPRRSTRATAAVRPVLDGAVVPEPSALPAASGVPSPAGPSSVPARRVGAGPVSVPAPPVAARPASGPAKAPVPWSPSAAERDAVSLGFPVPPHPPSRIVGEPGAVGGVIYRPFPDPRFVGNAEPLPADRGSFHIPRPTLAAFATDSTSVDPGPAAAGLPPHGHRSMGVSSGGVASGVPSAGGPSMGMSSAGVASGVSSAGVASGVSPAGVAPGVSSAGVSSTGAPSGGFASGGSDLAAPAGGVGPVVAGAGEVPGSAGRHTVPDELVQAATYRLPADRVFRARVPDAANAPGLPDEPTTRLSVPKPRPS